MNIGVRRTGGNATENQTLETEGIGGTEDRPDIIHTAHIIEDDDDGELLLTAEVLKTEALHLGNL